MQNKMEGKKREGKQRPYICQVIRKFQSIRNKELLFQSFKVCWGQPCTKRLEVRMAPVLFILTPRTIINTKCTNGKCRQLKKPKNYIV